MKLHWQLGGFPARHRAPACGLNTGTGFKHVTSDPKLVQCKVCLGSRDYKRRQYPIWTPITVALPESYQHVWVTYNDGTVEDVIEDQNICIHGNLDSIEVVAWMPVYMPAPYTPRESK